MNGVRIGDLCGGNDVGDVEVALRAGGRADSHRFVRKANVEAVTVRGGIHRHGGDAHLTASADHAERNLAAVGNQNLVEHAFRIGFNRSRRVHQEEWLVEFHGVIVVDQDLDNLA